MKAMLCPSLRRDPNLLITQKVEILLQEKGVVTVVCPFADDGAGLPTGRKYSTIETEMDSSDFIVALGGDGTVLKTARAVASVSTPIIAVNLGNVGFMADLSRNETERLAILAEGDYHTESRMMLDVALFRRGEKIISDFALNDAVVKGLTKMISLEISGDDTVVSRFSGDGVVVATPTGSTAYSMAAGGPIVEPDARNIIITPICSHVLSAKSFVMAPQREIKVRLTGNKDNPAVLSIDGADSIDLFAEDELVIRMSQRQTRLIQLSGKSFYSKVSEKLGEKR